MSTQYFYFPVSEQERQETLELFRGMANGADVMSADIALGLAAQDRCSTRDEFVDYARHHRLVPYLRFFLERRGWIDDDWNSRIDQVAQEFRHEVN